MESPPKLPLADPDGVRQLVHPASGKTEPSGRRQDEWIGRAIRDRGRDQALEQEILGLVPTRAVETLRELARPRADDLLEGRLLIEELTRGHAEHRPGHAGPQPDPG